jgi:hypothetical protein
MRTVKADCVDVLGPDHPMESGNEWQLKVVVGVR